METPTLGGNETNRTAGRDRDIRERLGLLFEESRPGRHGIDLPAAEFPAMDSGAKAGIEPELRR